VKNERALHGRLGAKKHAFSGVHGLGPLARLTLLPAVRYILRLPPFADTPSALGRVAPSVTGIRAIAFARVASAILAIGLSGTGVASAPTGLAGLTGLTCLPAIGLTGLAGLTGVRAIGLTGLAGLAGLTGLLAIGLAGLTGPLSIGLAGIGLTCITGLTFTSLARDAALTIALTRHACPLARLVFVAELAKLADLTDLAFVVR
jgi:hypothetical protein